MANENEITGTLDSFSQESMVTKAGKTLPKFTLALNGIRYTGIGTPNGVAKGDLVTLKLVQNGTFTNVSDIIKNGVSALPKRPGFGGGAGAPRADSKANILLAAAMVCVHNSKNKDGSVDPISLHDIEDVAMGMKGILEKL